MTTNTSTSVDCGSSQMPNACSTPIAIEAQNAPGDRTEPTDDDDDEGLDQDRQIHLQVDGLARDLQRARQAGEPGAERKHRA